MPLWFDKRYKTYRFVWRENRRQRMMELGKDRKAAPGHIITRSKDEINAE